MPIQQDLLFALSCDCKVTAELLHDAICNECHTCISEISDINRHALFEISEGERLALTDRTLHSYHFLHAMHALEACITQAFSVALLLARQAPVLAPLVEIVTCNARLAAYPQQLLSTEASATVHPYSIHLCANKARGAHALLLTNCCSSAETERRLLPLVLALELHRNNLEHACEILIENAAMIL